VTFGVTSHFMTAVGCTAFVCRWFTTIWW